ncbi:hypothetical protein CGCSCA4_v006070 [Colletotrichum siamense]|uniref:Uncharacterized protein n=1 Tax=Colletotrichum siamense TaxID=690259 RepID=A0A9P5EJU1_COLSI|nr:hypothetical protein CGCSCA4_v006070 [Colletotrichum siamense]KAF4851564.1 hypothetical protein CGCSCA2_v010764 [Colletotrichum siamense]
MRRDGRPNARGFCHTKRCFARCTLPRHIDFLLVAVSPLKSDWVDAVDGPGTLEAHTHHAHSHMCSAATALLSPLAAVEVTIDRHLKGGSAIATMAPTPMPN